MRLLKKVVSLKENIFKSLFLLSIASLLIFSLISFFLMKNVVERNNLVQNEIIASLFTEIIAQDVLVGAHHEVLKKCQNAISEESISAIEVKQRNGETICSIKKEKTSDHSVIHKPIYFDSEKAEKAAEISFFFSQTAMARLFTIYQYLILVLTTLIMFAVYYFSHRISRKISSPLRELNEYMAMNALISTPANNDEGTSKLEIKEFSELKAKFQELMNEIAQYQSKLVEASSKEAVSKVATQAAHDIRSPLEMLKSTRDELSELPEDSRRRIQLSINRMEEITFNLLRSHKQVSQIASAPTSEDLLSIVTSVVTEKNIEYRNHPRVNIQGRIDPSSYGLFSTIDRNILKSILSNLVNNGVESFVGMSGNIEISLTTKGSKNYIMISDNGSGLLPETNDQIFTKGYTTKKMGNGLGLYNAKVDLEALGGSISFKSEVGKGTTFTIDLPGSETPSTFVPSIDAYKYEKIIILDDDTAFHEVWKKRLIGLESKMEHIHSVKDMLEKYKSLHPKILLLSDFELMDKHSDGIDTILKLGHAEHSILVTARSDEKTIQDRCLKSEIKLLPKTLVNYIKVIADVIINPILIVLIDDDRLVGLNWTSYCEKRKIPFKYFRSIEAFLNASSYLDKGSRIFVDSNLGDGIVGEIESEKISVLGYTNLYLVTGFEKDSIKKPAWIKDIYSKGPENIGVS